MPPRGGRSTSRRSTPRSPPKQSVTAIAPLQATRRSTRSQSHDVDAISSPQSDSVEPPIQLDSPARRTRSKAANPELPTVSEEPSGTAGVQEDVLSDEFAPNPLSDDEVSNYSADTGDTTFAQHVLQALDRDAMIDALPDLYEDSDLILKMFENSDPDYLESLFVSERLAGRYKSLKASWKLYLPFPRHYIDVTTTVCKFRLVEHWSEVSTGTWRPDAVLQLSNLAKHLAVLFVGDRADEAVYGLLSSLSDDFPKPYMKAAPEGELQVRLSPLVIAETSQLAVELFTQFLIETFQRGIQSPEFDPESVVNEVFLNNDEEMEYRTFEHFKETKSLEAFKFMLKDRIAAINKAIPADEVDLAALEKRFPWTDFLVKLARWARMLRSELKLQIKNQGGINEIQRRLMQEEFAADDAQTRPQPSPKLARNSASRAEEGLGPARARDRLSLVRERKRKSVEASLLQRGSARSELPPSGQSAMAISESPEANTPVTAMGEEDLPQHMQNENQPELPPHEEEQPPPASQSVLNILALGKRQMLLSNKENIDTSKPKKSFIARQENAHRVAPIDDLRGDEETRTTLRQNKRRSPSDDDDDQEEAFEHDSRPTKSARTKRMRPEAPVTPPLNSADDEIEDPDEDAANQQLREDQRRAQIRSPLTQRPNPHSPASQAPNGRAGPAQHEVSHAPASSQPPSINYQRIRPRRPQSRVPFSKEETDRLIYLIEEYGTSWVNIMEKDLEHPDGPRLQGRDQGKLKDKARNLKMDFLKNGMELPNNFPEVKLGSRLVNILRDIGLDYWE